MTKQLLERFVELFALSNDIEKWTLANFVKNPPRLYRFQAINAMMKALKINCSLQEFKTGEFLSEQSNFRQSEFLIKIIENFPNLFQKNEINENDQIDYHFVFEVLFSYRLQLQKLVSVKESVIDYSKDNSYPITILDKINSKLQEDIIGIDNILSYLINPKEINFSTQELIEKYNYPIGELSEIDNDWI